MADNRKVVENHGCIVCGRVYPVLVVYDPAGKLVDCTPTEMGAHRVPDPDRPIVACDWHAQAEIDRALEKHYPGKVPKEDEEEE